MLGLDALERLRAFFDLNRGELLVHLELLGERGPKRQVVVDEKYLFGRAHAGFRAA